MQYTTGQLAKLAGLSVRTLRYYDQIGLLCPQRTASGYRIYGPAQLQRLQQLLFYRELGMELEQVAKVLNEPDFDAAKALQGHVEALRERRTRLDALIDNAEKTLEAMKGKRTVSDKEKFEGFKKQLIEDNEKQYGAEVRQKYGDAAVEASNERLMEKTQREFEDFAQLEQALNESLRAAVQQGDAAGETAQRAADLHRQWLCFYRPDYSPEMHKGLVQMYVDDARFTSYYEKIEPGAAQLLRDAVFIYCEDK